MSSVPIARDKTASSSCGATVLLAAFGRPKIHNLRYLNEMIPAGVDPAIMLAVALLADNLPKNRR